MTCPSSPLAEASWRSLSDRGTAGRWRRLVVLLGGVAWAVLVGCGADPRGPGSLVRLDLAPAADAPAWPRADVTQRLPLADGQWTAIADRVTQGPVGGDGGPDGLVLTSRAEDAPLALVRSGRFDPASFDEVRVVLSSVGQGQLVVEFYRGDDLVGIFPSVPLLVSPGLEVMRVPVLRPYHDGEPFDRLFVKVRGGSRMVGFADVELVRRPAEAWLPDPAGAPALVEVLGEGRLAEGLSTRAPLVAAVDVPPDGRLSLSVVQPLEARRGDDVRLTIRAVAGDAEVSRRIDVDGALDREPVWQPVELDLAALAGRRASLTFTLETLDGAGAAVALGEARVWSPAQRPRTVVLITSDTHRADHLGATPGGVEVSTPTLDALARQGVLFTDCLSVTNVTNPSHVALMTGVHPRDTGILHNSLPLRADAPTLAEAFAAAGYETAAVLSARHLGDPSSGLGQGFDRMSWPDRDASRDAADSLPLARAWLDEARGRPLFLWLHLFDAHGPYKPPRAFRRLYYPDGKDPFDAALPEPDVPASVLLNDLKGLRDLEWPGAAYRGEVSWLDDQLSGLLATARVREGLVAFTGDHGESFGNHGIWFAHAGLYPDTLAVPLVISAPGLPAGAVVSRPVGHLDLPATLLDLASLPPGDLPGRSFAELARSAGSEAPGGRGAGDPRFALSAHRFAASVTVDGWHLVLHLRAQSQVQMTSRFERHQVQLYDLTRDPTCQVDLAGDDPTRAALLRGRLIDWLDARDATGWAGAAVHDAEREAQLRALGYVGGGEVDDAPLWEPDDCERCRPFLAGEGGR